MNVRVLLLATVALACVCLQGKAQYGSPYYGGYGGYGNNYGGGTAAGNAMQGMSSVIQARGQANLSNSEAAKNYQDARSMEYDNRIKGTQTYFEMRKMNQAYTAAERSKPMTTEEAFRAAREAAPKRLSASQLDPLTGAISWPIILKTNAYQGGCDTLNALFAERETQAGGIGGGAFAQIQEITDILLAKLKSNISQYSPDEYIKAKKFLESLAYEARFPAA